MLEMLLSTTKKATGGVIYPDSGPGTKVLQFGDTTAGFFGEVTAAELIDGLALYQFSGIVGGSMDWPTGLVWLKFFLDGKVLFIAKQNVIRGITWAAIYNAGAVYGVRGTGTYPEATPVDQFKLLLVNEGATLWSLKLRSIRGMNVDPNSGNASFFPGSEWDRLMLHIAAPANGGVAPFWAQYTHSQLSAQNDLGTWVQETYAAVTTYGLYRGGSTTVAPGSALQKTSTNNWRPVLELIPPGDVALEPRDVDYNADGLIPPSMLQVAESSNGLEPLIGVIATDWLVDPRSSPSFIETGTVSQTDVAIAPADVLHSAGPLKEFGFDVAAVDTVVVQQYIWSIAPVEEFGITTETI